MLGPPEACDVHGWPCQDVPRLLASICHGSEPPIPSFHMYMQYVLGIRPFRAEWADSRYLFDMNGLGASKACDVHGKPCQGVPRLLPSICHGSEPPILSFHMYMPYMLGIRPFRAEWADSSYSLRSWVWNPPIPRGLNPPIPRGVSLESAHSTGSESRIRPFHGV